MYKQSSPSPPLSLFPTDIPPGCVFPSSPLCTFNRLGWEGLFLPKNQQRIFDLSPPCVGWPLGALRACGGQHKLNSVALAPEFICQVAKFLSEGRWIQDWAANNAPNDASMHVEISPIFVQELLYHTEYVNWVLWAPGHFGFVWDGVKDWGERTNREKWANLLYLL